MSNHHVFQFQTHAVRSEAVGRDENGLHKWRTICYRGTVEITIDEAALATWIGPDAVLNKSGKSTLGGGCITARLVGEREEVK